MHNKASLIHKALTIAGSDSGGGAGIQADLKTFAEFGVYGSSAITAITAQNTCEVAATRALEPALVAQQIDAVLEDIGADAAKTGMLASAGIVEVVAERLRRHDVQQLVIDPVLASSSGTPLLERDGIAMLKEKLLPLALIVTPNIPEAEALSGLSDMKEAARSIRDLGPRYVLITGGHGAGDPTDILFDGDEFEVLRAKRIDTPHTHGTGCAFSAAITAGLAHGLTVGEAVARAKRYITVALQQAYAIGGGHSPVNHFPGNWD
jgi:hydroxymethylpyrimidine/phosphomethylpyrimidine kinase